MGADGPEGGRRPTPVDSATAGSAAGCCGGGAAAAGAAGAATTGAAVKTGCGCCCSCWVGAGCPKVFAVAADPSCAPQRSGINPRRNQGMNLRHTVLA